MSSTRPQLALLRDVADQVMALFEMRRMAAALGRAAARDPLTGLANRRTLETAISDAIARAERGLGTPSVVAVDLDGFKAVNDTLGHAAGDAVLRRSAAQLLLPPPASVDTVARIGGDEFVVLLEHTGGPGAHGRPAPAAPASTGARADGAGRSRCRQRVAGHHDLPARRQRGHPARPGRRRDVRRQGPRASPRLTVPSPTGTRVDRVPVVA